MNYMDKIETFRNMLRVNKHRLDDELEIQSEIMDRIATRVAKLNSQQIEAKEDLARIEAELFSEYKEDKVANELANSKVRQDRRRVTAWQRYQVVRQEYEEWSHLLEAWKARGYSLRELGDLYTAQYFTRDSLHGTAPSRGPSRSDIRAAAEAVQETRRENAAPTGGTVLRRRTLT